MSRRPKHHLPHSPFDYAATVGRGVLLSFIVIALYALPAFAWTIRPTYTESLEYDTTPTAAPAPDHLAPNAAGSLGLRSSLSATSSLLSCSAVNLAVSAGAAHESSPTGISDGAGGAILVFDDDRNGAGFDLYAKHVLACGALDPAWPAEGVRVAGPGAAFQNWAVAVTDGSGGAFIVWAQSPPGTSDPADIYAQHLLGTGMVDPSWPANGVEVCTAPGLQNTVRITSDGAEGAFVTWTDSRFGTTQRRTFVQHLLSTGVDPAWTVDGIRAAPTVESDQFFSEICSDGAGGAIVAWGDRRTAALTNRDIFAQRVSASGALLWSPDGVPVCTAPGQQLMHGEIGLTFIGLFYPTWTDVQSNAIVPDGANGCFMTWADGRTLGSTGNDVYAQHLTASGSVAAGWATNGAAVCTEPGDQIGSNILSDGAGGAIATWSDSRPAVFVQHVSASGVADGPPGGATMSTAGASFLPAGVPDGSGGAVFTWTDFRVPDGDIYAQHVRTVPSFGVDPAWPVNGVAVSTAPGLQDILRDPGGGLVSNGAGGAIVFWTDYRTDPDVDTSVFAPLPGDDVYAQAVLADGSLATFNASGRVVASCPSPNTGLLGVTVDAYQVGTGDLVGAGVTDATGAFTIPNLCWGSDYTLTDVTPLDYSTLATDLTANGCSEPVNFSLACRPVTGTVQSMGFWKHNVGVATGGNGNAQINATTLCSYLDLIAVHFNSNAINQVIVYQPPASGVCADKLQVARVLLDLQGSATMIARARQQLMSLLLNVAAGYIGQTQVISTDGATVSQAITYCDNLIDSPTGNYEKAKTIADDINNGRMVAAGMIPLNTAQIAYRRGMEALSFRATPNPGSTVREFSFMTGARGSVTLDLFDVSGRLVVELCRGNMDAGEHSVRWDGRTSSGSTAPRGLYFARLQTPRESPTIKVLQLAAGH